MERTGYQGNGFAHRAIGCAPRKGRVRSLPAPAHGRAFAPFGFNLRHSLVCGRSKTNAGTLDFERKRAGPGFVRQL